MLPFAYWRAETEDAARAMAATRPGAVFIAGGTDLMQLCKSGVCAPGLVIDISRLPLAAIESSDDGIMIGALACMSDVAEHPAVRSDYPAIAEALKASASPQIRNAATIGGNLMQRSRCLYFRNETLPCNKRLKGSGCGALAGENRPHAIFGASAHCAATHASDLAVALVAFDARLRLRGPDGERRVALQEFYLLPGDTPERETQLSPGEMIVAVEVLRSACRSRYLKLRDRASFEFAVLSVAVALEVESGQIRTARIAAGGVGTKPWRLRACEMALIGERPGEAAFRQAAARAADGARPLSRNGFKLELLRRAVLRALMELGDAA
ncbi:xanthine dehydrogenase YagS FAD-binding subunit [Rhizobiales bacterium GAS113]|nr:xanthine dehydrogenase YagS FAD-binding subunit [Rhizobiales bacterium GAS113]